MWLSRIACSIVLLSACDAGAPPAPPRYELSGNALNPEYVTDYEPKASDVAYFLSRGYQRPQLVAVTLARTDLDRYPYLREWKETYAGIPVDNDVKSASVGRWTTRFRARVHEPELPDRKRLLSESTARAKAGAPASVRGRLAYVPRLVQRVVSASARPTAENYVLVTEGYDLVYAFDTADELVHVDAYAGTVERFSHWID